MEASQKLRLGSDSEAHAILRCMRTGDVADGANAGAHAADGPDALVQLANAVPVPSSVQRIRRRLSRIVARHGFWILPLVTVGSNAWTAREQLSSMQALATFAKGQVVPAVFAMVFGLVLCGAEQ